MRGFLRFLGTVARRRSAAAAGVVVAFGVGAACSAFEGLKLSEPNTKDSSVECTLAKPPLTIPMVPISVTPKEFVVALRTIDLGEPLRDGGLPDLSSVGWDLDNACTGHGQGPTCKKPKWARADPDNPGGRDNAFGNFFNTGDSGSQGPNTSLLAEDGVITTVMRISDYNGAADDGYVEVGFFAATGCTADAGQPICQGPKPVWDGNDEWRALQEWVGSGDAADGGTQSLPHAKFRSSRGVVKNNVLVAHLLKASLAFGIEFDDVWIQARLKPQYGTWALTDGTIAGRAKVDDILADIEFFQDSNKKPICTDTPSYAGFKRRACSFTDISLLGNDARAPCDAVSWAWKFTADPAKLTSGFVSITDASLRTHLCGPERSPKSDHCDTLDGAVPPER